MHSYNGKAEITKEQVKKGLDVAVSKVIQSLPRFTYRSQNHSGVNNIYPDCDNNQWTCGFWPGQIWLSFLHAKEACLLDAGLIQVESMLNRIQKKIEVDHHDMGFLYIPSCVAAYELLGNEKAKLAAILAADQMLTRFQKAGGFFQAWGEMGARDNYRFIIDCLMNLPLLFWASRQTSNPIYTEYANIHAKTCLENSFRADGSTFHTFFMDPLSGEAIRGETCQGYKDDSAWARGQAWAIYGTALMYRYTKDEAWFNTFQKAIHFYMHRLPNDLVPYWDLIFTDGDEPRDSSSAAITICGLLEMANTLDTMSLSQRDEAHLIQKSNKSSESSKSSEIDVSAEQLRVIAKQMTASLTEKYTASNKTDGLLLHATYSKKSPYNTCTQEGVDECVTWGDYFYMEALHRLDKVGWGGYW